MNELELYKWLFGENGLDPEMRWNDDELIVFIPISWLDDFIRNVIPDNYFDDGATKVYIDSSHVIFDLADICLHLDIEPENILKRDRS